MRKLLFGALVALSATGFAQTSRTVTFTKVLDMPATTPEEANGGTYVPGVDKFISLQPSSIRVYSGVDGAYETNLSTAGISPSGLGFQAATATEGGQIYAVEDGSNDLWRWKSISDPAPEKVYDTARKYWYGYTSTRGNDIVVGFSSPDISGDAVFFSDSSPFATGSFGFGELAPIETKMGLAFNKNVDTAWTVADTHRKYPIVKWNKVAGTWQKDLAFAMEPIGPQITPEGDYYQGGPLAYDEANNVLVTITMHLSNMKIQSFDASTGALLGAADIETPTFNAPRGGGAWVDSALNSGTFYAVTKGANSTLSANLYKYTYTVVSTSDIADWVLY